MIMFLLFGCDLFVEIFLLRFAFLLASWSSWLELLYFFNVWSSFIYSLYTSNFVLFLVLQTEAHIAEMEQFQRHSIALEGQNSIEQFDMEMLAHAMYVLNFFFSQNESSEFFHNNNNSKNVFCDIFSYHEAEDSSVPVCVTIGCRFAQQTRSSCFGRKILETTIRRDQSRIHEMAEILSESWPWQ